MNYRPEIDGLRAVAVLPVLFFHAGFELFSGGFVGVDVFFVISGYLITSIIVDGIDNNKFSIAYFYERRARRILPALCFVMLFSIPFAWVWMIPNQIQDFSQSLIAVSIFVSNIFFWRETDYFLTATEELPLIHTWSLAVEEQFYLLFPIFLILSWRLGKNRVFWILVLIALISFALCEWGWRNKPDATFFLLPTRAWELLAGSIAAFVIQKHGTQENNFFGLVGIIAIIAPMFAYSRQTPFPSIYTVLPILGTTLVILYANGRTIVSKFLSNKFFISIGLISYSVYLWHQPVFAFARIRFPNYLSDSFTVGLCILSLLLGYLSWKFIERPLRDDKIFSRKKILNLSFLSVIIFSSIGIFYHLFPNDIEKYWLSSKADSYKQIYSAIKDGSRANNYGAIKDGSMDGKQNISECVFNVRILDKKVRNDILGCYEKFGSGILIVGDSHAIDLFGAVASRNKSNFIIGITRGGCRPSSIKPCSFEDVTGFLKEHHTKIKLLIYEQSGLDFLLKYDGKAVTRHTFLGLKESDLVPNLIVKKEGVRRTAEFLENVSKYVKVKWFLPRASPHLFLRDILIRGCEYEFSYRKNQYESFIKVDDYIKDFLAKNISESIVPISQNDIFQFKFPEDYLSCDEVYWSDGDHFSVQGEIHFGKKLPDDFLSP